MNCLLEEREKQLQQSGTSGRFWKTAAFHVVVSKVSSHQKQLASQCSDTRMPRFWIESKI